MSLKLRLVAKSFTTTPAYARQTLRVEQRFLVHLFNVLLQFPFILKLLTAVVT